MSGFTNWFSIREAALPGAAVAFASNAIWAAAIDRRGDRATLRAHAMEPLRPGLLVPSLTAANVQDCDTLQAVVARILDRVGRPPRVGIVIPDPVVKVSLIRFEQVPPRRQDLEQLIRWQMRKAAPFPIEESQVAFIRGARHEDGQEFVVSISKRSIIEEYEGLCAHAGAQAGVVDTATFNVINAVFGASGANDADWLLVNVAVDYASVAILRGADLMFFRSRGSDAEGTLVDLVHQTAMYYEDRLQGAGFSRVLLSGAAASGADAHAVDAVRRSLEERLATRVEWVDVRQQLTVGDRLDVSIDALDRLAPLAGLLLRGQETAA